MTRPRKARAAAARDPMERFHDEWMGLARPIEGLVVAKQALLEAQVARPETSKEHRLLLQRLLAPLPAAAAAASATSAAADRGDEPHAPDAPNESDDPDDLAALAVTDLPRLYAELLGLGPERWLPAEALPERFTLALPDTGQLLRATCALVKDARADSADAPAPLALAWHLPPGLPLDERETVTGAWDYPPSAKLERLLRHAGVPIGLLSNGTHLRLLYAPHGAASGALTFRFADLVTAAGRPLLDALIMLLHARQWFGVAADKQLPQLLAASRQAQGKVTRDLAEQVLEALHLLLAGFEAAQAGAAASASGASDASDALSAAYRDPDRGGDHVYAGLLTFMLRLVFVLYAEDNGLLPTEHPLYAQHLSLLALHEELTADAGAFPDAMARRHGAYGRLLALFRAIYFGVSHGTLHMPPRHGQLFSPHEYPFLEGVTDPSSPGPADADGRRRVTVPAIDDETVYLVLHRLLFLGQERLSYKALSVEQLGSVYEALMGFSVEQLTAPAVCLKKSRVWLSGEQLAAEPAGARAKLLADTLALPKADADKLAKATGAVRKADAVLEALAPFATVIPPRREAGRYIIQPGPERRRSGSHYTPPELTGPIVGKTLAPLLASLGPAPTSAQLLSLKLCDPAMGSGAFLVEAVRQLGDAVVAAWRREGQGAGLLPAHGPAHAAEDSVAAARRLIAQRCIYGVDRNPQAVTLAKLSLWLLTLAKDKPFTFLDHALRHGDSLVGLDLDQLTAFHWQPGAQVDGVERELRQVLDEAVAARERITALAAEDSPAAEREKELLLRDAADAVGRLRLIGDLVVGAFFASDKPKEREAERLRRRDLVDAWLASARDTVPAELAQLAADFRAKVPAFHWMIELPEIFWARRKDPLNKDRLEGKAWIDGFVGNPPFAGKNTIAAMPGGDSILDWLKQRHPGSHGNADYSAHFFRRCDHLLGDHGTIGLLATNTIAQGDTRATGLQALVASGTKIYAATRSMPWPGDAAVAVSVVHLEKGRCHSQRLTLDGVDVPEINSRLRAGSERPDPVKLKANEDKSFQGTTILGMGFTLTPDERDRLVAKNPKNAERVFPYLGGDEINSSPTQSFERYVINFGDLSLEEAGRWPDLLQLVREKVKPERDKNNRETYRTYWWHFGEKRPALAAAVAPLSRCLVASRHTKHLCFVFQPVQRVFSEATNVFAFSQGGHFASLQSRVHEAWARLLSSSMKTDLRYSASECFETFPFPPEAQLASLEPLGQQLYDARAAYLLATDSGLTTTYNQLKDPHLHDLPPEHLPALLHLRHLHEQLDRAVLAAYGWSDLTVPPFCPATPADRAALALFEDQVIDRLFALNATRAAAEARTLGLPAPRTPAAPSAASAAPRKPRAPKPRSRNQTSLLDED